MTNIVQKSLVYSFIFIFSMFLGTFTVFASSYTPTNNMFENTYSNNLIDMANNQIDLFTSKKYAVFQIDNDYYLVCSNQVIINSNSLIFNDSTIIKATRTNSGYNSYYEYSTYTETQTSVYLSYVVISNVQANRTVSSSRFDDYKFSIDLLRLCMFILAIVFASFLLKERSFL